MNANIQKQINQELEQYRLEVQNQELQTQVDVAKTTIANQNQHVIELYSAMNFLIVALGTIVAIFGIAIPLWNAFNSLKMSNELKEIKKDVDGFISTKLKEWENQSTNDALDKYIKGELSWRGFHTILKWQPMTFEHINKIMDFANIHYKQQLTNSRELLSLLAYYLFIEHKDNISDDFKKGRELIINSHNLYVLALESSKTYIEILKGIDENARNKKVIDLLNKSNEFSLSLSVKTIIEGNFLSEEIEQLIATKLLQKKDRFVLKIIENNINIVEILKTHNLFENIQIWEPRGKDMQISCWNGMNQITADSYLAKEILKFRGDYSYKISK